MNENSQQPRNPFQKAHIVYKYRKSRKRGQIDPKPLPVGITRPCL